jgi:hypothetical protein
MEQKRNDSTNEELFCDFKFELMEENVFNPQVGSSSLKESPVMGSGASIIFMDNGLAFEEEFVQLFDDFIFQETTSLSVPGSAAIQNLNFPSFENKNLCKKESEKIRKKRKPKLWDSMIIKWRLKGK